MPHSTDPRIRRRDSRRKSAEVGAPSPQESQLRWHKADRASTPSMPAHPRHRRIWPAEACLLTLLALLPSLVACERWQAAAQTMGERESPSAQPMTTASDAIRNTPPSPRKNTRSTTQSPRIVHEERPFAGFPSPVHRFSIPLSHAHFSFIDLAYRRPLIEALGSHALIFNGGYWAFAKETRVIQGLVIVNDKRHAPKTRASGGVVAVRNGTATMVESAHYAAASGTALALQCSPRLLSNKRIIAGLNSAQKAARTALCIGSDRERLAVYLTEPNTRPTLPQFAAFLQGEGCSDALNLDGGPSTAAAGHAAAGPIEVGYGAALPYGIAVDLAP